MFLSAALNAFKSSALISWKSLGKLQQTIAGCIERSGITLHSGRVARVKIWPECAGVGRYFDFRSNLIHASVDYVQESPLCTTLCKDGYKVQTVEHLLSALEAMSVDNCRIEVEVLNGEESSAEVPIFDGSAKEWVEAIKQVGLKVATDQGGNSCEKMIPFLIEPVHVHRNDSFIAAFPCPKVQIIYGIDFPQVPAIGCQWFSSTSLDDSFYTSKIGPSRTFCIYEEQFEGRNLLMAIRMISNELSGQSFYKVEKLCNLGLIKGGSADSAIVCSASKGWLNPPLRFPDEPCRHKVLDLIGDLSLFARHGSQGFPVAQIVGYKGGHALHADFVRHLSGIS